MKKLFYTITTFFTIIVFSVFVLQAFNAVKENEKTEIKTESARLILEDREVNLLISNTDELRSRGLGGISSLPEDFGMLFVFPVPGDHGIWMKDMNFPIDIVWLDDEKRIIHIENDISPDTYPDVFYSKGMALYILEANVGFAIKNRLKKGQILEFSI